MMQWSRQQAVNFGTRVVTEDIVEVDFKNTPSRSRLAMDGRSRRWP